MSQRDVEYLLHKGTYRLKALTPAAKEHFAQLLEMPEQLIANEKAEIFLTGIAPESFPDWIDELHKFGLQTEEPPKEPEPPPSHLWEW